MSTSNGAVYTYRMHERDEVRKREVVSTRLTLLAALPAGLVWLAPFARLTVGPGYINFHDAAILLFLGYSFSFRISGRREPLFGSIIAILIATYCVGFLSTIVRWGTCLHLYMYFGQFILYSYYALKIFQLNRMGLIKFRKLAGYISYFILGSAVFGIMQYAMSFFSPHLADSLMGKYFSIFNIGTEYTDVMVVWQRGFTVRIGGPWLVATTYGGMLMVGMPMAIISDLPFTRKILTIASLAITLFLTGSRHAWIGMIGILFMFMVSGQAKISRWMINVISIASMVGLILIFNSFFKEERRNISTFEDIISGRIERTVERGLNDTSFTARFINGPLRFFNAVRDDPTILACGVGIAAKYAVEDDPHGMSKIQFSVVTGFVSNSFLLSVRGCGLLCLICFLILHLWPLRSETRNFDVMFFVFPSILIWMSDNYVWMSMRAFLVAMTILSFAWMSMTEQKSPYKPPALSGAGRPGAGQWPPE